MNNQIIIITDGSSSFSDSNIFDRLSAISTVEIKVVVGDELFLGHEILPQGSVYLVLSDCLTLALRMEGHLLSRSISNSLLVLVSPEQWQLARSLLLPTTVIANTVEMTVETVTALVGPSLCRERQFRYLESKDHLSAMLPCSLSKREKEILALFINGLTSKEAAWRLGISTGTLAAHRRNLYHKTGLNSLSQLVVWGMLHGVTV